MRNVHNATYAATKNLVAWCVCLSIYANLAKRIEVLFEVNTFGDTRHY